MKKENFDNIKSEIEQLEKRMVVEYKKGIISAFEDVVLRKPNEAEIQSFLSQLKAGFIQIENLKYLLTGSQYRKDKSEKMLQLTSNLTEIEKMIERIYLKILNRHADPESLKLYAHKFESEGMTEKLLQHLLTKSEEYYNLKKITKEFKTNYTQIEIKKMIDVVPYWYHSFKFGDITTPNPRTDFFYQKWITSFFPLNFIDKTILDIGTADGFYSFICEGRGAKKVTVIDENENWFPGFKVIKKILNSKVEFKEMSVYDINNLEKKFDVILFFSVYYHLRHPALALEKIFSIVNEDVYFVGPVLDSDESIFAFYDANELHPNDDSNWWVASPSSILKLAKRIGFNDAEILDVRRIFGDDGESIDISQNIRNTIREVSKVGIFKFSK